MPVSPEAGSLLPERLARAITLAGPISIADYMAAANAHYYATRDPLGAGGDFTTAPEISQMFGELAGAWAADLWYLAGRPDCAYVELGPGRGTLAVDALRVLRAAGCVPAVHFVETSPVLLAAQADRLPGATWHDDVATLPANKPLLVIANEFFDALPIHQLIRTADGWRERRVACQDTLFVPVAGKVAHDHAVPPQLRDAPVGAILETSPASVTTMRAIARRIADQGGGGLFIDYGYDGPALGDTLQAVRAHGFANPFEAPGERDLTAHVDFTTLGAAAMVAGAGASPTVPQGRWLNTMGIGARAQALAVANPERADEIAEACDRLTAPERMGGLFKVLAITAPGWPSPAGFA